MRKKILTSISVLTVLLCALSIYLSQIDSNISNIAETDTSVHFAPNVTAANTEASLSKVEIKPQEQEIENTKLAEAVTETDCAVENRLASMLNLNFCYGDAFYNPERIATAITISLNDYADDLPAYGIYVNKALISGFALDFYGKEINFDQIEVEEAPEGYYPAPCFEYGTQFHKIKTITEIENGYEVISTVSFYYGGSDLEQYTAISTFENAPNSPFSFNLTSCILN